MIMGDNHEHLYFPTKKGFEHIWSWINLQLQLHEMECLTKGIEVMDDECPMDHEVAMLLPFVVPPLSLVEQLGLFDE